MRQRAFPLKAIPAGARLRALAQLAALRQTRRQAAGDRRQTGARTGASATMDGASATIAGLSATTSGTSTTTSATASSASATVITGTWQHIGPPGQQTNTTSTINMFTTTVPGATNYGAVGGRVTTLALDPTNANTLYAGTADGGVWKTTGGGGMWTPTMTDTVSLAIGALAIAPTAPYTIYAMTGEGNNGGDNYYGAGVLESTDGGSHWTLHDAGLGKLSASRLVIDPLDPAILYAAMNPNPLAQGLNSAGGIYRSTDGGATWTLSLGASSVAAGGGCAGAPSLTSSVPGSDIAVAAIGGATTVYAALGAMFGCTANGIYKSTDNGQSWTRLQGFDAVAGTTLIDPASGTTNVGRIALGLAPSNPSIVYAAVELADPGWSDDGTRQGVYESTDGGITWTALWSALSPPYDLGFNDTLANQYWYDLYVAVDPTNPGTVYLGGVDIWKGVTTNGVTAWTNLTNSYANANDKYQPGPVHPDQHALVFAPNGTMYAGNDGGVYETTTSGAPWTDLNAGLDAIQLYGVSVSAPGQGTLIYRGAQDNDVSRDDGTGPWTSVVGGDGTLSAIDPANARAAYAGTAGGWLFKTTDGGNTWVHLTGGGANDPACSSAQQTPGCDSRLGFVTPLALDQANPNRLLMGTYKLWESTNGGATWNVAAAGQDLTGGSAYDFISALAIAPGASSVVYAGTSNGYVQVTTDDGSSWTNGTGVPNRFVTSIAVSSTSSSVAWAAFSGFNEATPSTPGHIFQTTDGGHTWHNVSGDLPDVPVNALVVDPTNGALYAGTDVGVFTSTDDGATWTPVGNGLPNAPVFGLTLRGDGVLYAATHGRGLWSLPARGTAPPTATPTPTQTNTPAPTSTSTPLPGNTNTPAPTSTSTPVPTNTTTPVPTSTYTPVATATSTPTPTNTNTPLPTSTHTPVPTSTRMPVPTSTRMPVATSTHTPIATSTYTPLATATSTLVPTRTNTPVPTSTNTSVPTPTTTPMPPSRSTPVLSSTSSPPGIAPATMPLLPTSTATTAASPTATATTRPAAWHHRLTLPLTLLKWQRSVRAGDTLAVRIHTLPHARVFITIQVMTRKAALAGKGKYRTRVTHLIVLYQATFQGTANGRGQFSGTVRISYRPAKPVPARLTVTVLLAQRIASRTVGVTILPRRHSRRH